MNTLKYWLSRMLYGGGSKLRPYEQACVDRWRDNLDSVASGILLRQLSRFNLIQRQAHDRIVAFYCVGDGANKPWPSEDLFPLGGDEVRVARLKLRAQGVGAVSQVKADIVLHDGRLSSLEFSTLPKHATFEVADLEVLADVMGSLPSTDAGAVMSKAEFAGWLLRWSHCPGFVARHPLRPEDRDKILKQIDAVLPQDYLVMLEETNGFRCDACIVFDPSSVYKRPRPQGNYYVLAEVCGKGDLLVEEDNASPKLYFLGEGEDELRDAGTSLSSALQDACRE